MRSPVQVCLDDARVKAFVSMTLSEAARREVEDHVDDCDECRRLLVAMVRSSAQPDPLGAGGHVAWEPGAQVGRYVVARSVGRGAMGEVFRAEDTELKRPVALKRLHASQSADARSRLVREARAAAQLQHPNVVAVYEIVTDGDAAVLACEWIDGVTLREHCAGKSWREIVEVVADAGRGLAAAHAAGIVHRDFKPENVLVDREGRARVADFGLASGFEASHGERPSQRAVQPLAVTPLRITMTGTIAGTPAYMAPELLDGARPDARSDQFSFAVTLFEMVHGKYPYAGVTAEAIWAQMATSTFVKTDRRIPAWLDRAIKKALSPDPAERFASLDALLDRIDHKTRRAMGVPLVAAGAIGGVAVAGLLLALPAHDEQPPCGEQLVDQVWSQAARAAYTKQFTLVAPARSAASLAFADQVLEQWTDSWRLGRRAACAAEPTERRARTACLDRQLGDLRAQLAVWSRADASIVDHTAQAVATLPSPAECTTAIAAPVSSALVTATAELDALRRAGKFQDARPKAAALVALAAKEPDLIAKARAFYAAGAIEFELREHAAARTHFAVAAQAARQAGDERLLAETLVLDAATRIIANKPAEALGLCDAIESLTPPPPVAARLEAVRGEALTALFRPEEGLVAYRRAVTILEKEAARDPSLRLQLAANMGAAGSALGLAGKFAEGLAELEKCLAIEEPILGPNHPEVGRTLFDMANLHAHLGDEAKAAATYQRVRTIFEAALGPDAFEVAAIDAALGHMAMRRQDWDEAYAMSLRARDIFRRAKAPPKQLSSIETTLGNIQQDRGDCAKALPHYEAALGASKEAGETGTALAISFANVGGCLADVGKRDAEARNMLEAALAAYDSDPNAGPERAHTFAVLADLEARQGRYKQAIELGERAAAVLKDAKGEPWDTLRGHLEDSFPLWRRGRHQ